MSRATYRTHYGIFRHRLCESDRDLYERYAFEEQTLDEIARDLALARNIVIERLVKVERLLKLFAELKPEPPDGTLEALDLPAATLKALYAEGLTRLELLLVLRAEELLKVEDIDEEAVAVIESKLASHGLRLFEGDR